MLRCLSIIGARPQFIKAAPLSREFLESGSISEIIVHTGQHFDSNMSEVFFVELGIPEPKYKLNINGGSHGRMTGNMLVELEDILLNEKPDCVLVYGDTNTTLAGALAAVKLRIPVVHIESGLRSFNRDMPEEINRIITDHSSDLLFCPTSKSIQNLRNEGIECGVYPSGELMYDTFRLCEHILDSKFEELKNRFGLSNYIMLSLHRAGNVDCKLRLQKIASYIKRFAKERELPILFPIHPRTKSKFLEFSVSIENCHIVPPLSYFEMQAAIKHSSFVLTDSGGMQKEAYFHRVPCITLRDETEWLETIECGWNKLWNADESFNERREITEYGDGYAAKNITSKIIEFFNNKQKMAG